MAFCITPNNSFSSPTIQILSDMKKLELVFVPVPVPSHLTSTIEFAKLLLHQDERLSITFLIIPFSIQHFNLNPYTDLLPTSESRIRFTVIPPTSAINVGPLTSHISFEKLANTFFETHKSHIEQAVIELLSDHDHDHNSTKLIGFVLDIFSSCMIDVANRFNVPSYIFFTSNTAFLGFLRHLPIRHNEIGLTFRPTDPDSIIPSYHKPVPTDVLPGAVFDETGGGYEAFLYHGTKFQEAKGIIVNSFLDLEPFAVGSMVSGPTVYPVGPLLDLTTETNSIGSTDIKKWLDNQPPKSVLFLCFGSNGSFNETQLAEIAIALERSDHRFVWSIRKPPPKDTHKPPSDYMNLEEVLPQGFLSSVEGRGLVCGWAPQVEVLAHKVIKGFVSHCGWNSILESMWFGVPIATWPLNAEQQLNAFLLVKELWLGVELSLSYRSNGKELIMADEIEKGINRLMDDDKNQVVKQRVKEISEKSRKALIKGGSSFVTLRKLVQDMLQNIGEMQ